ncbi:uncharacterized protein LOC141674654 [Apium graveolens]|uniref:uncharacterized protein LOC141674654 n=1 Tax=Apium graveolens TaxID=4045 RepID=UPI003D79F3EB
MDLFERAKTIRLRTIRDKFLVADDNEETVFQHRDDSSTSSVWNVEIITGGKYVRFKSCYGTYLTASDNLSPGIIGKKVVQSFPKSVDMSMTDWEPVRDGFQVRLRTRKGSFLRPNGGVPPWRNTVTHDMPQTSKTHEKVLWSIDVVEALPPPHRRSRSAENKSPSGCSDDRMSTSKTSQRYTTMEDL